MSYIINTGYSANGFRSLDETLCPEFTPLGRATIEIKNFKELPESTKLGMICGLGNHCATCEVDTIIDITDPNQWFVGESLYNVYKKATSRYLVYLPREDTDCDVIVAVEYITDFVRGISSIPSEFSEMKGETSSDWDRWEDILFLDTEDVEKYDHLLSVARGDITTPEMFKKLGKRLESRHSIYGVTPEISVQFEPFPVPNGSLESIAMPGTFVTFNADYDGDVCFPTVPLSPTESRETKLELSSRRLFGTKPNVLPMWRDDFDGDSMNLSSKEEKFVPWADSAELEAIRKKHDQLREKQERERTNELISRDEEVHCDFACRLFKSRHLIKAAKERVKKATLRYVLLHRTSKNPESFLHYLLADERDCLSSWMVTCAADGQDPTRDLVEIGYHCIEAIDDRYFYECVKNLLANPSFEKYHKNIRILDANFNAICTETEGDGVGALEKGLEM